MYIDKQYILHRISNDRLNILTGSSDINLNSAIASASSLIDTYMKTVVKTVPIPDEQVSETIKRICFDITIYYLHDRPDYLDVPEAVKSKYKSSIEVLQDLSTNKLNNDKINESNLEEPVSSNEYTNNQNIFSRSSF